MRKLLLISLLAVSVILRAEDFKILYVNTGTVKIGKTLCSNGDVFNGDDKIYWSNKNQAIKALSLETKKQYIFVSDDFKKRKLKSARDLIIKSNRLSTRGLGDLSSVASQVEDRLYWLNSIAIPIDYEPEQGEYFFLKIQGQEVMLAYDDGQLIIDDSIWSGGEQIPIITELYFHHNDGENESIKSEVLIIPLPSEIL